MERSTADRFRAFAHRIASALGTPWAFAGALASVVLWALAGPLLGFSERWQLLINTGTTIVTFLMIFLVQATQNRDARAIHLKLDELIRATKARNAFADLEEATDDEIRRLEDEFRKLAHRKERVKRKRSGR